MVDEDIFAFWDDFNMEDIEKELAKELRKSDNGKIQKLLFAGQRINYNKVDEAQGEINGLKKALYAASLTGIGVIVTVAVAV